MTSADFIPLTKCVICGSADLRKVLDLGKQPLANAFHDNETPQCNYPLALNWCGKCSHLQQAVAVDPAIMFADYSYVSGTTRTLGDYFDWFVDKVEKDYPKRKLKILEIACNDGSLLKRFQANGHEVLGVDPAQNLLPFSKMNDVPVICKFWDKDTLGNSLLWEEKFDVIIAMNVVAHVAQPVEFMRACRDALKPTGRIYIQTSQAHMLKNGEFDTVYHEHISFFSPASFKALAGHIWKDDGLYIRLGKLSVVDIHGGSFLVEFNGIEGPTPYWDEAQLTYLPDDFQASSDEVVKTILAAQQILMDSGWRTIGYGAAAKGMTFLNYSKIHMEFVVDDATLKQGKFCPGTGIPVRPTSALTEINADIAIVILAWNFRSEIITRIKAARPNNRDLFITCFPKFRMSFE